MKQILTLFMALSFMFMPITADAQDFWEPTNGPYGGHIYSLAINAHGHIVTSAPFGAESIVSLCTPFEPVAGCFPTGIALCNANEKYTRNRM